MSIQFIFEQQRSDASFEIYVSDNEVPTVCRYLAGNFGNNEEFTEHAELRTQEESPNAQVAVMPSEQGTTSAHESSHMRYLWNSVTYVV